MKMPDTISVFLTLFTCRRKTAGHRLLLPAYYDLPRAVSYQYNKEEGAIVPGKWESMSSNAFYLD
jgi:hypothetical protein